MTEVSERWFLLLDAGRLIADGTPAEVAAGSRLIAAYLGMPDGTRSHGFEICDVRYSAVPRGPVPAVSSLQPADLGTKDGWQ